MRLATVRGSGGDGTTFYCAMCLFELEKPDYVVFGFSSAEEATEFLNAGWSPAPPAPRARDLHAPPRLAPAISHEKSTKIAAASA